MKCQKWQLSLVHQWAKRASIAKRSFSALSMTEKSGKASASKQRAKREISVLSIAGAFNQAKHEIDAKPNSTYPR